MRVPDRMGREQPIAAPPRAYGFLQLSPDIGSHLDIGRLQIAMDDAQFVRGFERFGDLVRDGECLLRK